MLKAIIFSLLMATALGASPINPLLRNANLPTRQNSQLVRRQLSGSGYALPSGAELLVGSISSSFSCDTQAYGYYADIGNKCQIFHICAPSDGGRKTRRYSFVCGEGTVFDQLHLVCKHPKIATPCDQAQSRYSVNLKFGKI